MPYSQFTSLRAFKKQFQLTEKNTPFFETVVPMEPTDWLRQTLGRVLSQQTAYFSEKSRSEAIVFPVLLELQHLNNYQFALYSGAFIEADKEKGLNGECDFVLSRGEHNIEISTPFFCIVEAKDNDLELGIPQCAAQMLGARIFNKMEDLETPVIYGCVTTGEHWLLLKLDGQTFFVDSNRYYLKDLPELLGALNMVVRQSY